MARESIYLWGKTVKVCCWPSQMKVKCFWWIFMYKDVEKGIWQINSCISGTRGYFNLFQQWNYVWYSSYNWSHHLIKFIIIHCHSPKSVCLLHKPNRRVEWGCGGITTPMSFSSLMVAQISSTLPRMWYCFRYTAFLGRSSFKGFHVVFHIIITLTPQIREPKWGFYHLLSMSIPIMHSGTGEITTGCVWGPIVRQIWAKTLLITWPP